MTRHFVISMMGMALMAVVLVFGMSERAVAEKQGCAAKCAAAAATEKSAESCAAAKSCRGSAVASSCPAQKADKESCDRAEPSKKCKNEKSEEKSVS